jgi:hypothetical protein
MNPTPSLSLEAFAAVLAANGHTPDAGKLHSLYAALHSLEALQGRIRSKAVTMASEPSHVFAEPAVIVVQEAGQ